MKKILAAAIVALPVFVQAQELTLVCQGWAPFYQKFDAAPMNPDSKADSLIIKLDLKKKTASYRTQVGQVVTNFKQDDEFYYGETSMSIEAGGMNVQAVGLSLNRLTGDAYLNYKFRELPNGKVLFSGKCAQGKHLF